MANSKFLTDAQHYLEEAKNRSFSEEERSQNAIKLAGCMLCEAKRIQTAKERSLQGQLARMMHDPVGKSFTTSMTDQCFRSSYSPRIADQLTYLIKKFGVPHFLSPIKKMGLVIFKWLGKPFAFISVPLVRMMLRGETSTVILPGEPSKMSSHMKKRRAEGVRINLNHLGEAILGEEESLHRLSIYLNDLANPEIEYISIKISTIYSQINLLGKEMTLGILSDRLKQLYRAAKTHKYTKKNGEQVSKFVNLDMEEYRDLNLTVELFRLVLDDPEFHDCSAGIVLQSYIPDSFNIQKELTAWAMARVAKGGAPIKIRIVKGANLAMEQVEASMRGWEQAPYAIKSDVDANFKRMLLYGCQPQHAQAVNLGIASHNLFDVAYTLLLRAEKKLEKFVCFEMLEGMADHIRRTVQQLSGDMLLYCPTATQEEFQNAVAYLVRRLDENTAPENFLRHAFDMVPGSKDWQSQAALFSKACSNINDVSDSPRRKQNRLLPPKKETNASFKNEADTDWTLPANLQWAENIIINEKSHTYPETIPLVLGSCVISDTTQYGTGEDPSYPGKKLYKYALAGEPELEIAMQTALIGFKQWSEIPLRSRLSLFDEAAHLMRFHRGDLIGAMIADTGKTIPEGDVEVSEAIDFIDYYKHNIQEWIDTKGIECKPKGVVLVAPPWNFPCSIPTGGIMAALAAGNAVIFKPAPESILVGWRLVNILWQAGISKEALQFFCCPDEPIGNKLIQDNRINAVILTGATSTAKHLRKLRPALHLLAETGGKNALIVTRMADRDLAVKDLVQSAFGHAGQKCSACSLAIVEKEVYDDPQFRKQLRDAAASLMVGSPWDPSSKVNPLVRVPNADLLRALTQLDKGEEWLLKPQPHPTNPNLWSPGIKLGVKIGSFTQRTELFGPVLGIMCAKDLEEAISMANATSYGLTAGIHTLDEREQNIWISKIIAGNCYINRGITGAVVLRQPFGGCKESCMGGGAKAGGPNYLLQLMDVKDTGLPNEREPLSDHVDSFHRLVVQQDWTEADLERWTVSLGNYAFYYKHYFSKRHDPSMVLGQHNFLYYVPQFPQVIRIQDHDSPIDALRAIAAALTCSAPFEISISKKKRSIIPNGSWNEQEQKINIIEENDEELIKRLHSESIKYMRFLSPPSASVEQALADVSCHTNRAPVQSNGRLELLNNLREVSLSIDYHRYGYLGTD